MMMTIRWWSWTFSSTERGTRRRRERWIGQRWSGVQQQHHTHHHHHKEKERKNTIITTSSAGHQQTCQLGPPWEQILADLCGPLDADTGSGNEDEVEVDTGKDNTEGQ